MDAIVGPSHMPKKNRVISNQPQHLIFACLWTFLLLM
jgi:hypothetical protein